MIWLRSFAVFLICLVVTTMLTGPVFYQKYLVESKNLRLDLARAVQYCFGKSMGFYVFAFGIYGLSTFIVWWLYQYMNFPNGVYAWRGIWEFRVAFWVQSLLIYGPATMIIFWLYDLPALFYGLMWAISMMLLLADRTSTTGWIYFFKQQLPDFWMVLGIILLVACMLVSMLSHTKIPPP